MKKSLPLVCIVRIKFDGLVVVVFDFVAGLLIAFWVFSVDLTIKLRSTT